jgi:putative restriction endonuclease
MSSALAEFLITDEWDAPFFKRLANNDTAAAPGHQGGMVITQDLRQFFPTLEGRTSRSIPTIDRTIWAEMFRGLRQIAHGSLRYQVQTWGGKRSPESRITEGFGPIHRLARGGDILIFQRRSDSIDFFRLILIRQGTRNYRELETIVGSRLRGPLYEDQAPVNTVQLQSAVQEVEALADQPFVVTKSVQRIESRQLRVARSSVFPLLVRQEYGFRCCVSGVQIESPSHVYEVEAAHVVPVTQGGSDDVRNGLALSRSLHWAFDRGLFGIKTDRTIYIPRRVNNMEGNRFLTQFAGKPMASAQTDRLRVHDDALRWHRENVVAQFD